MSVGLADVVLTNPNTETVTKFGGFTYVLGTGPINYIQKGDTAPGGATATVLVPLTSVQTKGNLNVVIVGWGDISATVSSVTDSEGNAYVAALSPTLGTGLSQVIYYAKNIKGDTGTPNQVTVTFNHTAQFPDVRVLEYSGLDTASPLDVVASAAGSGRLADTGVCTTTTPVELVVAGGTVSTLFTNSGDGYTLLHLTQPNGNIAEQQITSVAGSCEATAPLELGDWVIQSVAFKVPPAVPPDFSMSSLPTTETVVAGSPAGPYAISVTALGGFASAVTLACDPATLPTGAACGFVPNPVTPGAAPAGSNLTITTTGATPAGTSNVKVTGTAGAVVHNVMVTLTVTAPPVPDFTVTAGCVLAGLSHGRRIGHFHSYYRSAERVHRHRQLGLCHYPGRYSGSHVLVQCEFSDGRSRHVHADLQNHGSGRRVSGAMERHFVCDVAADWRARIAGNRRQMEPEEAPRLAAGLPDDLRPGLPGGLRRRLVLGWRRWWWRRWRRSTRHAGWSLHSDSDSHIGVVVAPGYRYGDGAVAKAQSTWYEPRSAGLPPALQLFLAQRERKAFRRAQDFRIEQPHTIVRVLAFSSATSS